MRSLLAETQQSCHRGPFRPDTVEKGCNQPYRVLKLFRWRPLALAENSIGLVTALGPVLGYEACSRIARWALDEGRTIAEIVLDEGLLTDARLNEVLRLEDMTRPSRIAMAAVNKAKR